MYGIRVVPRRIRAGSSRNFTDDASMPWGGDCVSIQLDYSEGRSNSGYDIEDWLYIGRPMAKLLHDELAKFLIKDAEESRA